MTQEPQSGSTRAAATRRRLFVRVALAAAVVTVLTAAGIATALLLYSEDESRAAAGRVPTPTATEEATASASPTRTPRPATRTPRPTPPPDAPDEGEVVAGGDQPSAPLPPAQGNLPENNANQDMLALRDILQQEIDAYSQVVGGIDVGIAVTDLQTDETVSVNGNVLHKTGCTINLFAFLAAVKEFEAGNDSPWNYTYAISKGIGGSYPPEVKNFLNGIFGDHWTGVQRARELMTAWGMQVSSFDHVPYYGIGEEPPPNILTALEANAIFSKLYHQQLFSAEWTAYTMDVLTNIASYVQYILPKYLPWNATVAHKIGYHWDYDGWVNNDAGIVSFTGADGVKKAYVVSYFSQRAGTEAIGYSFGAKLSRTVWDFMAPRYGIYSAPAAPWYPPTYQPPPATAEPTASPAPVTEPPVVTPTPKPATPTPKPVTATPKPATPTPKPPTPTPTQVPTPTATPQPSPGASNERR